MHSILTFPNGWPKKIWGLKEHLTMYEGDRRYFSFRSTFSAMEWFYVPFLMVGKLLTTRVVR